MGHVQQDFNEFQRGYGTALSPNLRDLVAKDALPVPAFITQESSPNLGTAKIPVERYIAQEFHDLEVEKIWKRVWQVACREEEIPNVGDHFIYRVANLDFLIVRNTPTTFKAFWNVCLHRGRCLVDQDGKGAQKFRCGYHAWTWDINGKLVYYPGAWDFPDVTPEKYSLREVLLDTWGGFIFINPDKNAAPLSAYLGTMPQHFDKWKLEDRYSVWHVQKRISANWKVSMEAFLESYHLMQTHPQALSSVAEHATQYDIYDEDPAFFSRTITPTGIPSVHAKNGSALGAIKDVWALVNALRADTPNELPADIKDRASIAQWRRDFMKELTGADYASLSDTEMLDSYQYWLFPNFCPWYGEGLPLSYVFRPDSNSPESSYFDIWMLVRKPDAGKAPPAPPMVKLAPTDKFEKILGAMGLIFDQDDDNMPFVQKGLHSWPGDPEGITLGRYQESRIRFFHQTLMKFLSK